MHLSAHTRFDTAADIAMEVPAGAPDAEIEVTPEMAAEGARVLADMFEYAAAHDWHTMERAAEVFRKMWNARV
jgi:hypothetical protein